MIIKHKLHIESFSNGQWQRGPEGNEDFCLGFLEAKRTEKEGLAYRIMRSDGRVLASLPERQGPAEES
jgi:hypothetical protein